MVEAECESERNRHIPFFHRIDTYADTMIVFVLGGVPLGKQVDPGLSSRRPSFDMNRV